MRSGTIGLLPDLVRCLTVSGQGISEVLDLVLSRIDGPGWRVQVDGDARFALGVPEGGAERLFACHADTAPFQAGDWSHNPLAAESFYQAVIRDWVRFGVREDGA